MNSAKRVPASILIIVVILTLILYSLAINQVWLTDTETLDDFGGGRSFGTVYLLIELVIILFAEMSFFWSIRYWFRPSTEQTFPNHILRILSILAAITLLFFWLNTTQGHLLLLSELRDVVQGT